VAELTFDHPEGMLAARADPRFQGKPPVRAALFGVG
jgi:hypothetical protein